MMQSMALPQPTVAYADDPLRVPFRTMRPRLSEHLC